MTFQLPESHYSYGYVIGRWANTVADTAGDEDPYPDGVGSSGTVKFAPLERGRVVTGIENIAISHNPETFSLNAAGRLIDKQDKEGVWLVTGDYTVTFNIQGFSSTPINITVSDTNTLENPLDLILYSPPVVREGDVIQVLQVPLGGSPNDTLVRDENGQLVWSSAAYDSAQDAAGSAAAAQAAQAATENALPAFEQAIADALDVLIGEIQ